MLVMAEGSLAASAHCQFWFSGRIEPVIAKVVMIGVADTGLDVGCGAPGFAPDSIALLLCEALTKPFPLEMCHLYTAGL